MHYYTSLIMNGAAAFAVVVVVSASDTCGACALALPHQQKDRGWPWSETVPQTSAAAVSSIGAVKHAPSVTRGRREHVATSQFAEIVAQQAAGPHEGHDTDLFGFEASSGGRCRGEARESPGGGGQDQDLAGSPFGAAKSRRHRLSR